MLAYSWVVGLALGLAVLAVAAAIVVKALAITDDQRGRGRAHAQAFIARVRTCHRRPPHPAWADCERLVQGAE